MAGSSKRQRRTRRVELARRVAGRFGQTAHRHELEWLEQRVMLSVAPGISDVPWRLLAAGTRWYAGEPAPDALPQSAPITLASLAADETVVGSTQPASDNGEIRGTLWHDRNGNGTREPQDTALVGRTVYVDLNGSGGLDSGDLTALTDAQGQYAFTGLGAGQYVVAQVTPAGWNQSAPAVSGSSIALATATIDPGTIAAPVVAPSRDGTAPALAFPDGAITDAVAQPDDVESLNLVNLPSFQADPRFDGIDGSGFAVVVIDTGMDLDHPAFGPDADANGVADRIVYQYDLANGDNNVQDYNGHGTVNTGIIASQDPSHPGVAPGVDIIHLKVVADSGGGASFLAIEGSLQWVISNAAAFNIAAVNISLSDGGRYDTPVQLNELGDELQTLASMGIIAVGSAGNTFYSFGGAMGVSYPAADPYALAVGAVYDANLGAVTYTNGAQAYSTDVDRITPYSMRHATMLDALAPGSIVTGPNATGGYSNMQGTSMSAPFVTGAAVLAQQLAMQTLERRLTFAEFQQVLDASGTVITDGDNEDDNVAHTQTTFPRLNLAAMGQAILNLTEPELPPGAQQVLVGIGQVVSGIDFGSQAPAGQNSEIRGTLWEDHDGDAVRDPQDDPLAGWTVYLDGNGNGELDAADVSTTTDAQGQYAFPGLAAGTYVVAQVVPQGWVQTVPQIVNASTAGNLVTTFVTDADAAVAVADVQANAVAAPAFVTGEVVELAQGSVLPTDLQSEPLINLDDFRIDTRFAGINGSGYAAVVIDTGIDINHPAFGPDADSNGVSDRIVFHYDYYGSNDSNGQDFNGHGSNVASIIGSSNASYLGVAPGVNLIALKVFPDGSGSGNFLDIEEALQWTLANLSTYNIASVNLSLSDGGNFDSYQGLYGISDEFAALAAAGVITVAAAGNDYYSFGSTTGVAYPAADFNTIAVGAVFDANIGSVSYGSGAQAYSSGPNRITPYSQRHNTLMDTLAPGSTITGANHTGSVVSYQGTSQAAPHIAGAAVLAQQLAEQELGRRLTFAEFRQLLSATGVQLYDGDDEDDNVAPSSTNYPRIDMLALGSAILDMAPQTPDGAQTVTLGDAELLSNIDFASQAQLASVSGKVFNDLDGDGLLDGNESGLADWTVFADADLNGLFDAGERYAVTDAQGDYTVDGLEAGPVRLVQQLQSGWVAVQPSVGHNLNLSAGQALANVHFANAQRSAVPGTPDLLDASDTGASSSDNLTRFDSSNANRRLSFSVSNAVPGATLALLNDGVIIASSLVPGSGGPVTHTISTVSGATIQSGSHQFTIVQYEPGKLPSLPSGALAVTIDPFAPQVGVQALTTFSDSPALSGTVNDPAAVVQVTVNSATYTASNLGNGQWSLPGGAIAALTPGVYSLTVTATDPAGNVGTDATSDELTVRRSTGDITGTVWNDADGDGVIDAGEAPLTGRLVYVDLDHNQALTAGEPQATSDAQGGFTLADLQPGSYSLRQVVPDGWLQTWPLASDPVAVSSDTVTGGANFGSRPSLVAYQQQIGGSNLVVMEAEINDGLNSVGARTWSNVARSGAVGTAMQALPNSGVTVDTNVDANSPRMDFRVNFTTTGIHYVWVRGMGLSTADDSIHVGIDGVLPTTSDKLKVRQASSFGWNRVTLDGPVATVNVTSVGAHIINVWMREDGAFVDRLLLTTNSSYVPGTSTTGEPAVSERGAVVVVPLPEVEVTGNGVNINDGSSSTSGGNHTDFGVITQGDTPVTRVFTVKNTGTAPLTTANLAVPAGFSIVEGLAASIEPGQSDTFTVQLDSTAAGARTGQITFDTNDSNESPFNFSISGLVNAPPPDPSQPMAYQQVAGGHNLVVIEAEINEGVTTINNRTWANVIASGASGTAMQALPNSGVTLDTNLPTTSPRVDYRINFATPGTYYVWVRGMGLTTGDDSIHIGLDGQAPATSDKLKVRQASSFGWNRVTLDGPVATITIATPGLHMLNLWMREDGAYVDRLALTTNSSYIPGSATYGEPATSQRVAV